MGIIAASQRRAAATAIPRVERFKELGLGTN